MNGDKGEEDNTSEKTEIKYQHTEHETPTDSGRKMIDQQDQLYRR